MDFNTGQAQELAGVRREQLRHWRGVLPPLSGRDGRADRYTFAEVLSLAVVAAFVDGLGLNVSRLRVCAGDIFAAFVDQDGFDTLPGLLHVTDGGELVIDGDPGCDVFASVRVGPIFSRVRGRLAPEQRRQLSLAL